MKKLFTTILAVLVAFSCFSFIGCGPQEDSGIDKTKIQLYVANYNGGFGDKWLESYIHDFEELYSDYTDENYPGKMGVQIVLTSNKELSGTKLPMNMPSSQNEVYFSENVYYYNYKKYFLDITDVVEGTNSFDGGKTIESKLSTEQKGLLKNSATNNKYYAIPHYAGFTGIMYNTYLFEEKNLYYSGVDTKVNATIPTNIATLGTVKLVANKNEKKSNGPDGHEGTYDDGLPATYEEFFALCNYMLNRSVTPFIWNNDHLEGYFNWLTAALQTDYEGYEQMKLNFTFDGTAKNLVTVDGNTVTPKGNVQISKENGYEVYSQAGRYYAYQFLKNMISNDKFYRSGSMTRLTYTLAQTYFIQEGSERKGGKDIAMMPEGIWWEEEAKANFDGLVDATNDDEYGRYGAKTKYAYMPLPKATKEKVGTGTTLIDTNNSFAFINANISTKKIGLAKDFLRFCYTDDALKTFTKTTNTPKALTYDLDSVYDELTFYGKSVWDTYKNADIVYSFDSNQMYQDHQSTLITFNTYIDTINNRSSAIRYFDKSGSTVSSFFNGSYKGFKDNWSMNYKKYWE